MGKDREKTGVTVSVSLTKKMRQRVNDFLSYHFIMSGILNRAAEELKKELGPPNGSFHLSDDDWELLAGNVELDGFFDEEGNFTLVVSPSFPSGELPVKGSISHRRGAKMSSRLDRDQRLTVNIALLKIWTEKDSDIYMDPGSIHIGELCRLPSVLGNCIVHRDDLPVVIEAVQGYFDRLDVLATTIVPREVNKVLLNLPEKMQTNVARYIAGQILRSGMLGRVAEKLKGDIEKNGIGGVNYAALAGCVEPSWSLESGEMKVSVGVCCPSPGDECPPPESVSGLLELGKIGGSGQYWTERVCQAWGCSGGQRKLELELPELVVLSDGNIVHRDDLLELFQAVMVVVLDILTAMGEKADDLRRLQAHLQALEEG